MGPLGLARLFNGRRTKDNDYIDLGEYLQESKPAETAATMYVKVADLARLEELRAYVDYVYKGNMLILDFTTIAEDEVTLRRATNELKSVVQDVGGDIAGFGKNLLLITPTGVKIDRQKLKATA
jgi:uncharacterized protein